jgi:acyl-CoA synthetase (AMP-forming)/AMP-acid ligase II
VKSYKWQNDIKKSFFSVDNAPDIWEFNPTYWIMSSIEKFTICSTHILHNQKISSEAIMIIGDLLTRNARNIPHKEGLIWNDERITWEQLNQRVNSVANGLMDKGIKPGSRVAFLLNNGKEIVELYFAIAKMGCISVPIMPRSVGREIAYIANNVEASALIVDVQYANIIKDVHNDLKSVSVILGVGAGHPFPEDYEGMIVKSSDKEPGIKVDPDSLCTIFHTSGTTGQPKGCLLKHGPKVLSRLSAISHVPHMDDDKALVFYPLTLSLTTDMLQNHVLRGITTVILRKFDEIAILDTIEKEHVTLIYVIESTFDRLINHPDLEKYDLSSLRYFYATSATKDASIGIKRLRQLKGFKAKFWNAYGSTEGGGWLTHCSPDDIDRSLTDPTFSNVFKSIGREALLCRIDCVDDDGNPVPVGEVGEMAISAPWLFSGYWKQPEQTGQVLRDGRLFTGDLITKDNNGFIFLVGRKRDMIKTGGVNVYPAEIEAVLRENPKVREVAVVGVPDEEWGEKVVACILVNEVCTEDELLEYCVDKLAGYKRPKSVIFLDSLPVDKAGKILKRQLREDLSK